MQERDEDGKPAPEKFGIIRYRAIFATIQGGVL
jgi:hypothetical protein